MALDLALLQVMLLAWEVVTMLIFELQAGILKGAVRVRRKDLTYVAVDDDSSLTIFFIGFGLECANPSAGTFFYA